MKAARPRSAVLAALDALAVPDNAAAGRAFDFGAAAEALDAFGAFDAADALDAVDAVEAVAGAQAARTLAAAAAITAAAVTGGSF